MTDPRRDEILDIVAREAGVPRERLVPEARIDEVGIASIDMVQAIFEIEGRFGVEIPVVPERSGAEFTTIGDLLTHVLDTLDAKGVTAGAA